MFHAARYLRRFTITALIGFGVCAGINAIVDPYRITNLIDAEGFNTHKPLQLEFNRHSKPLYAIRRSMNAVIFGNSQVERGIDPAYPALKSHGIELYNFGLGGLDAREAASLLNLLAKKEKIHTAIVMLNFFGYELRDDEAPGANRFPPDWDERKAWRDFARGLFSLRTLRHSIRTYQANQEPWQYYEYRSDGFLDVRKPHTGISEIDDTSNWDSQERNFLKAYYGWAVKEFSRIRTKGFEHGSLRQMMRIAREHNIRLIFGISPQHVRQWEIIALKGALPVLEQWKAEIACVAAEEAAGRDHPPFPVWDFGDYGPISTERLATIGAPRMYWFEDSVHFSPNAGNAILNRVLDLRDPQFAAYEGFGQRLQPDKLAGHFAMIRRQRAAFLHKHPTFQRDLRALYEGPIDVLADWEQYGPPAGCGALASLPQ